MARRRKKKSGVAESLWENSYSARYYYNRLLEIATTSIKWENLPKEIDERFLEYTLATQGMAVFFKDDVLDKYVALTTMIGGTLSIYRVPNTRQAYATNGYRQSLNEKNSVLIFNNYLRTNILPELQYYAYKLYNIDRTIDININGQKTPILLLCDENERLAVENMYLEYTGNMPVIHGYKNSVNYDTIKAIPTPAEYNADKLYDLKLQIWNEALTFLGVANTMQFKRERVLQSEMQVAQGQVIASRNTRIRMRQQAADQINEMFGLNIKPTYYQSDYPDIMLQTPQEQSQGGGIDE